MPCAKYEVVLNPQTSAEGQRRAIESILGQQKFPGVGNDFLLEVVDMYLYTAVVEGPRCDDLTYLLDLEQTRCQAEKIQSDAFTQRTFDVSPSTYALTVAYQDLRCGQNSSLSVSKFKSYDVGATAQQELKLDRFFINYSGQNKPSPDANDSFTAGKDYTIQRYADTQLYSGGYFDSGGSETIEEFHDRGSYYYFAWPRDGADASTRCTVHNQFTGGDVANLRCLLFDHSKQVARIQVSQGRVISVELQDA